MRKKETLAEFITRNKQINENVAIQERTYASRYSYKFGSELDEDDEVPQDPIAQEPVADAGTATEPPAPEATDFADPNVPADPAIDTAPPADGVDPLAEPTGDDFGSDPMDPAAGGDPSGDTEIDVTELVNTSQEVSQKVDGVLLKLDASTSNINNILQMVNSLEGNINQMSSALNSLSHQVELLRPPTEEERRKVVQQNSYPFNQTVEDSLSGNRTTQTDLEKKLDKLSFSNILSTYNSNEIKNSF